jgi:SAM-dependent methyltransferase
LDWEQSALAWIEAQGERGDFSREWVLDAPMLARVRAAGPGRLLDLGCGEGRFCRLLQDQVDQIIGLDPTPTLIARAAELGGGRFLLGRAEVLPFDDASFDMVVSYLSLLDIEDIAAALNEVKRVLRPGGRFLIANLSGFATAADIKGGGWSTLPDGARQIVIRRYLEPHAMRSEWKGISVTNWHRPMSFYMQELLRRGFELTHFDEPAVTDMNHPKRLAYNTAPYQLIMEWRA